ncbi:MAG: asparagine synthase (glutamine-hydrolyzing) [Gammaproteobacteria bacterium]|nr:asparagine synthase (glutamine-hydrolyzing) [Gammaproteobacteria bacterium]
MCGIVGFFDQVKTHDREMLQRMTDSQRHRGPDAEGHLFEKLGKFHIGLGHRRLSILDTKSHANQPMQFASLTIVYNGEIYNFSEIRIELEKAGYIFFSASDTEVILKAFHYWGVKSLEKFRGMFAFCLYDSAQQKAYLIRDRVGVKPLYFFYHQRSFMFASEVKTFSFSPLFKKTLSANAINSYFQYGYVGTPHSIFENIVKVKPGHYVEFDLLENTFHEHQYWDLSTYYHLPKLDLTDQEATETLHQHCIEAFSLRMVADVPVGILLSGGIDSSLITAILQNNTTRPLETFTMGFADQGYDEALHAQTIAAYLGTNHHHKRCTWQDAESVILSLSTMYDEPLADHSAIPTALVSEFAKQKVTVALSGDGGDELFCGYPSYSINEARFKNLDHIPFKYLLVHLLSLIPDPLLVGYQLNYDWYNRYLKLKTCLGSKTLEAKFQAVIKTFTYDDIKKLFSKILPNHSLTKNYENLETIERMMFYDFKHYLPDNLMVKVDRATMHFSLEGREPLLDHKILEFAARLPLRLKKNKLILKKILNKYLPASMFERKKQGFGLPLNEWLRKELNYLMKRYLDETNIKKQGIFDPKYVKNLSRAFSLSKTHDQRVWTLIVFQLWYEKNFAESF